MKRKKRPAVVNSAASKKGWRTRKRIVAARETKKGFLVKQPLVTLAPSTALLAGIAIFLGGAWRGEAVAQAPTAAGIDFSQPILDIVGNVVLVCADGTTACPKPSDPLTLAIISENALDASYGDEATIAGDIKARRGALALKIAAAGSKPLLLSPEDVAMIKQLIGKAYPPLTVARAWPMLDPSMKP